ncbi:MAG: NAD(P)/FAD-dependent oxidoreductase [Candidatus Acidiferrales bacterium]
MEEKIIQEFDALILGGGAAGLICAIEAGKRGRKVAILERNERTGKKILISGGGRCNFTNLYCQPENFICSNRHFPKSALARYTPADFISLLEAHRVPYHEKALGQLFCDRSAHDVTSVLAAECNAVGTRIFLNTKIREIKRGGLFEVSTQAGEFHAPVLAVATGGPSIPKLGATSFGYDVARQFGLKIVKPRPALVPLIFGPKDRERYCELAGVSTEVVATTNGQSFREKMLITHRGLSGPAILQISSYWEKGREIRIDLAPGRDVFARMRESEERSVSAGRAALQGVLPKRFATRWLELNVPGGWSNQALTQAETQVHVWPILPVDTEGYEKAEVTAGGVDTDEISSRTMESKKVPGLFFIGEVVDVTGQLGGHNFQWAWASGVAAGKTL